LIKETVDAVRIAELEAEKIISTANDNAANMKQQIKIKSEQYRKDFLQKVNGQTKTKKETVIQKCHEYDREFDKQIEKNTAQLREIAADREKAAVDAVIDALV
jgi:N-acyl-D-aspartate/D-glutamate deacylase